MMLTPNFNVSDNPEAAPKLTPKMVMTLALCFGCVLLSESGHTENNGRIVKWKDEHGVTHYGDKIPPQYSNRENSLINKQGITVQQNKIVAPTDSTEQQAQQEQAKKDKALLGTFSSAEEIDLTRDRNLEPDLIQIKNMQQDRAVHQKKHDAIKAQIQNYTKSKKPVPAELQSELDASAAELAKIDQKISARQQAIDAIKKRFDEDKKRYIYLREKNAQGL